MGLTDKLMDKFIDEVFSTIKNISNDRKKIAKFSVIWNDVRDEYESVYGRDALYHKMWSEDRTIERQILSKIRQLPASREFVSDIFLFVQKITDINYNENMCINFVIIFVKHLMYSEEFSQKIINVRQDYEQGGFIKILKKSMLQSLCTDNDNYIEEKSDQDIFDSTVIDMFADNFLRVMFMQKKNEAQIKLSDIYVENDYKIEFGNKNKENFGLLSYIYHFCSKMKKSPILFIEGHAGIGKSSLVSKMAYDFKNRSDIWKYKKLAIIQLRNLDLNYGDLDLNNPWADFKRYLKFNGSIRQLFSVLDNYVLVLDGFDELCLIENIRLKYKLTYVANIVNVLEDYQCECKVIITTRPNYLAKMGEWKLIYQDPIVILLEHFSCEKRKEWIKKAKEFGLKISAKVEKNLVSIVQKDVEVVASTPFTLYLIAHENIEISESEELWSIYTKIFGEEVGRKRYDMLNNEDEIKSHPGIVAAKDIYMITKEIAYYMFYNNTMDINWSEITHCIDEAVQTKITDQNTKKVENERNYKNLLKDSYALFSYYKEAELSGGISFYHNYIREFFVQEKIHEELKRIYLEGMKNKDKFKLEYIKERLFQLLCHGRLSDKIIDFLQSYEKVNKGKGTWGDLENRFCFMKKIFSDILIDLNIDNYNENIIINLWRLLYIVNLIYIENKDNIKELYYDIFDKEKVESSNGKNNIEYYFELISIVTDLQHVDLSGINLRGKTLNNITFYKSYLENTILSGAILRNVKFVNCTLRSIDFRGAVLENVHFKNCKMEGGVFRGAEINISKFTNCSTGKCQFQGSKIIRSVFNGTNIENSLLDAAEFIQTEICDIMNKDVSSFRNANISNLKWGIETDKEEFYKKLNKLDFS